MNALTTLSEESSLRRFLGDVDFLSVAGRLAEQWLLVLPSLLLRSSAWVVQPLTLSSAALAFGASAEIPR